ncbi:hypothetical protein WMY93_031545 [Mugilogobius chulae]|uniref:Fibronectin type-III domain-containing protein n=1 Tax=Mugilogobius chulae TaxID=88201 RepID=A0AAW0MEF6_9GOBI
MYQDHVYQRQDHVYQRQGQCIRITCISAYHVYQRQDSSCISARVTCISVRINVYQRQGPRYLFSRWLDLVQTWFRPVRSPSAPHVVPKLTWFDLVQTWFQPVLSLLQSPSRGLPEGKVRRALAAITRLWIYFLLKTSDGARGQSHASAPSHCRLQVTVVTVESCPSSSSWTGTRATTPQYWTGTRTGLRTGLGTRATTPQSNDTTVLDRTRTGLTWDWDKSNDTTEYEVISTTKGPDGEKVSVLTTNQTHTAVENLSPDYEFKVKPKNDLGTGPESEPVQFNTESGETRLLKSSLSFGCWTFSVSLCLWFTSLCLWSLCVSGSGSRLCVSLCLWFTSLCVSVSLVHVSVCLCVSGSRLCVSLCLWFTSLCVSVSLVHVSVCLCVSGSRLCVSLCLWFTSLCVSVSLVHVSVCLCVSGSRLCVSLCLWFTSLCVSVSLCSRLCVSLCLWFTSLCVSVSLVHVSVCLCNSLSLVPADPRVSENVSGKAAIWTEFPFRTDSSSDCRGRQFVKRTWYRKFVESSCKFFDVGDQSGFGEDHWFYRAVRQEPVYFGSIGGRSHVQLCLLYECGTPVPGKGEPGLNRDWN